VFSKFYKSYFLSKMKEQTRTRKSRKQITERDQYKLLPWIGEQECIREDHLRRLIGFYSQKSTTHPGWVAARTMRQRVTAWLEVKWPQVVRYKLYRGEPARLWLTRWGLETARLPYAYRRPKLAERDHFDAINHVRLYLQAKYQAKGESFVWTSQRRLEYEQDSEEKAHIPDGVVKDAKGLAAVEVELTRKKIATIRTILRQLLRHYPSVWYFVNHNDIEKFVWERISELTPEQQKRFYVAHLDSMPL
jgi:hypothetical protein